MLLLKATQNNINKAAKTVKNGGLVIYPTDTVYGLGCDPFKTRAVEKLLNAKKERKDKPLPILASSLKAAEKVAKINRDARKIAEKYWPGPVTLVVPKKSVLPNIVTCGLASVGVRVPNHQVALKLIDLCGGLLIGTSANRSNEKPPRTASEADWQLGNVVDIILDGGKSPSSQESSIIDLTSRAPKILREGPVKLQEILEILKTVS